MRVNHPRTDILTTEKRDPSNIFLLEFCCLSRVKRCLGTVDLALLILRAVLPSSTVDKKFLDSVSRDEYVRIRLRCFTQIRKLMTDVGGSS